MSGFSHLKIFLLYLVLCSFKFYIYFCRCCFSNSIQSFSRYSLFCLPGLPEPLDPVQADRQERPSVRRQHLSARALPQLQALHIDPDLRQLSAIRFIASHDLPAHLPSVQAEVSTSNLERIFLAQCED